MSSIHRRGLSLGLAAFALNWLSACGGPSDECHNGDTHCDGHVVWFCSSVGDDDYVHLVWKQDDCGAGACVDDAQGAFCALDSAPNPDCTGDNETVCSGAAVVQCRAGYTVFRRDCATNVDSGTVSIGLSGSGSAVCVSGAQGSFCVPSLERDPACRPTVADAEVFPACSGNDMIQCTYGFASRRTSCNDRICECNGMGTACTLASCAPTP